MAEQGPPIPIPSPFPNIEFPKPWWLTQLKSLVVIGCLDPALMFVEMAAAAAIKAAWTIETPSTKQIIHRASGKSWVCSAKTILTQAEEADELAQSGNTRFMYGLWRGLDTLAYYQFIGAVIGQGLMDMHSMVNKYNQTCNGGEPRGRGVHTLYGAPWYPGPPSWGSGPTWLNAYGRIISAPGNVKPGGTWSFTCWFSLKGLSNGGCVWDAEVYNTLTGTVYDVCSADTISNPNESVILHTAGAWPHDAGQEMGIGLRVRVNFSIDSRIVAAGGGCYAKGEG